MDTHSKPDNSPRINEPIPRFTSPEHWERLVNNVNQTGIWLDDLTLKLPRKLAEAWEKLPLGGFIGGPSWGCGPLPDGRFSVDTRTSIESFFSGREDASERFTGDGDHPCWMAFKKDPTLQPDRVLILSGSDERQLNLFGTVSRENHEFYAQKHGYQYRWLDWDRKTWKWERGGLVWAKHHAMAEALEERCWDQVWWIDADAVFLNMDKAIDGFLHPGWNAVHPEFTSYGRVTLSTGVFGCRPPAAPLYRQLWDTGLKVEGHCEERILTNLIEQNPDRWKSVQLVEHSVFNGYYGWNVSFSDPARNFICHLVRRSNVERRRIFTQINRHFGV